jgi:uncharacterized lipoprotein YehR (DUF1307 family)
MKKFAIRLLAVCVMALAAGLTSCKEEIETQIFDLSFDGTAVEQGDIMNYQANYEPIFILEIAKVAPQPGEDTRTFMVNTTENKAKTDVKKAFDDAAAKAQAKAGTPSSLKGLKVILKYSTATKNAQNPVEFATFTFN